MTDKMTLDKLFEKLEQLKSPIPEDEWYEGADDENSGIDRAIRFIRDNRARLEAGMRGVLRFRKEEHPIRKSCYVLVGIDGSVVDESWQDAVYWYKDELTCLRFAESLGLTAEFVGDV